MKDSCGHIRIVSLDQLLSFFVAFCYFNELFCFLVRIFAFGFKVVKKESHFVPFSTNLYFFELLFHWCGVQALIVTHFEENFDIFD